MDSYKISLVAAVVFIVVLGIVFGLPAVKLFLDLPDYGLYVDPVIDSRYKSIIAQVLIQNTGSQPLTNVKVDFGDGNILFLGTIGVRDRMILTPPADNMLEIVTVTADNDVSENKKYREERLDR